MEYAENHFQRPPPPRFVGDTLTVFTPRGGFTVLNFSLAPVLAC